jgi:hypothetical protein
VRPRTLKTEVFRHLLGLGPMPSHNDVIGFDLTTASVDLETVPLAEVLDYREAHRDERRRYMTFAAFGAISEPPSPQIGPDWCQANAKPTYRASEEFATARSGCVPTAGQRCRLCYGPRRSGLERLAIHLVLGSAHLAGHSP